MATLPDQIGDDPVAETDAKTPNALHAADACGQLRAQEAGVGGLVRHPAHSRQTEVDRGRGIWPLREVRLLRTADSPHLVIDRSVVRAFCQRHGIARLALFGSALRDDFGPDSDVDVLVEFEPGHVPGLNFVSMERELSGLLQGRRVDLVTPKFLNVRIREQVLREAEPLYVAA
jgi:hypothetical protein